MIDNRTYTEHEIMTDIIAAQIDPKNASIILQTFATALPLQQYNLTHMKRVRRDLNHRDILEVLICPARCYDDVPSELKQLCKPITRTVAVPRLQPLTRQEYEEWGKNWPTLFRPNAIDKEREKGLSPEEMAIHTQYMKLVDIDAQRTLDEWNSLHVSSTSTTHNTPPFRGGAIVVNPHNGLVSVSNAYSVSFPSLSLVIFLSLTYSLTSCISCILIIHALTHLVTHSLTHSCFLLLLQVVTTSHAAMQYIQATKGPNALRNPLMDSSMLCIEGTTTAAAAAVLFHLAIVHLDNRNASHAHASSPSGTPSSPPSSLCLIHLHSPF